MERHFHHWQICDIEYCFIYGALKVLNKPFSPPYMCIESQQCMCYMWGRSLLFIDLSVEDDLNINQTAFPLWQLHTHCLSPPHSHTHKHIHTHICMYTPQLRYSHIEKVCGLQKQTVSSVGFCLWQSNRHY